MHYQNEQETLHCSPNGSHPLSKNILEPISVFY